MGNTDTSIDNLKLVKIIKPYHNGFGRLITPSDDPILNITRYAAETADKLIEQGVVEDMHRSGRCMFAARNELAKEIFLKNQQRK